MLTAYFDESYNHSNPKRPNEPLVYAIGCWLSTVDKWKKFGKRWKRILKTAGVDHFHMNKYESRHPPYNEWSESKRIRVLQELHGAIKDYTIYGNAIVVNRADWDEIIKPDKRVRAAFGYTPYGLGVLASMIMMSGWCDLNGYDEPISYLFAHLPGQGRALDTFFNGFLCDPGLKKKHRLTGIWSKGLAKEVAQLQAADIIAYEAMKRVANLASPDTKRLRESLRNLNLNDEKKFDPYYYGRRELIKWVKVGLGVKPIGQVNSRERFYPFETS